MPASIKHLKRGSPYQGVPTEDGKRDEVLDLLDQRVENAYDDMLVLARYFEYALTSPLYLIAIYCLLVVDGPGWVISAMLWMMVVCNLMGVLIQYTVTLKDLNPLVEEKTNTFMDLLGTMLKTGSWSTDDGHNIAYYMQTSWWCFIGAVGSVLYIARGILLSPSGVPMVVLVMLWNMFLGYIMFAIVPSCVYAFGYGKSSLDMVLDLLNLFVKFPVAVYILVGLTQEPNTFQTCS